MSLEEMLNIETVLWILGGQTVVLGGLFSFLGKVWINRINNNEISKANIALAELQSEIQATQARLNERNESVIHTHKYLVEVEYDHYQKIWAALTRVSPLFDSVERKIEQDESIVVTATELHEARVALGDILNASYPFINKSIYDMAYLALDYSTKASSLLWANDSTMKSNKEITKMINRFKESASQFHLYNRKTGEGIHIRTMSMVEFHNK